jgi:SHAQKYF class myb-like DNA-binding protein
MQVAAPAPAFSSDKIGTITHSESSEKENSPEEKYIPPAETRPTAKYTTKTVRRYVHNKAPPPKNLKVGRWSKAEHQKFLEGMECFPKQWKRIAELIGTRTVLQVRTHAQKFFQSTKMVGNKNGKNNSNSGYGSSSSVQRGGGKTIRRPKPKSQKRKSSTTSIVYKVDVSSDDDSPDYISSDDASPDYYRPQSQPQPLAYTSASHHGYDYNYDAEPAVVDCDRPWKRVKNFEPTGTPSKISATKVTTLLLSACRAQDGVHSRNSVDAVSALLSLGAAS